MWRNSFIVLLGMVFAGLGAAEAVSTLPPEPVRVPALPHESVASAQNPEKLLLTRVQLRLQRLDAGIAEILSRYDGRRPLGIMINDPNIDVMRDERDQAWQAMQDALSQQLVNKQRVDIIDRKVSAASVDDERRLQAENQLDLAECHVQLGQAGTGPSSYLTAREILEEISLKSLPPSSHPRLLYLRCSAAFELARLHRGAERDAYLAESTRFRDELRATYPESLLTFTADSLLTGGFADQVIEEMEKNLQQVDVDGAINSSDEVR